MHIQNKIFIILLLIISAYFILIWNTRNKSWEDRYMGFKILHDDDRNHYYKRGLWLVDKTIPYKTSFQEYPQLAAYLFALPHIFKPNLSQYRIIFSAIMVAIFLFAVFILLKIIELLEGNYKNLLAFAFPSVLWFSLNRFDLMPAALSLLSLWLILKDKNNLAFFVLGLAVMTKWYPVIYAPLFLNYIYNNKKCSKAKWVSIFMPSLTLLFTIIFISLFTILWAGIDGFLSPYKFHQQRGPNGESLFYFVSLLINIPARHSLLKNLFFVLQFISIPILLIKGIKKKEGLVISMGIATLIFILFAKFHSPQWLLWVSPILLLIKDKFTFVSLLIYDLSTYIYFPLGADLSNKLFSSQLMAHNVFNAILLLNIGIKIFIFFWLFKKWKLLHAG